MLSILKKNKKYIINKKNIYQIKYLIILILLLNYALLFNLEMFKTYGKMDDTNMLKKKYINKMYHIKMMLYKQ